MFFLFRKGGVKLLKAEKVDDTSFFHHYQPIYDVNKWCILGYEGLFRTEGTMLPEDSFIEAINNKKLYELDSRSIHKAFTTYAMAGYFGRKQKLFLNVFPSTILNPNFRILINQIINEYGNFSQQIIFEINENEEFHIIQIKKEMEKLRDLGFSFAIDDFGKGSSNLRSIIELQPEYIKLDRYFMDGLQQSNSKQQIVRFLIEFSKTFNSELIIEGVEDSVSLALVKGLGVRCAQGFLLGRPTLLN